MVNIIYDTPIRGQIIMPHPDGETMCHIDLTFIALDREDDVNKLQSLELTGAHINECAEVPQGVHQMLRSRINRYPEKNAGGAIDPFIIADYNSVDTGHWLYKLAEETKPNKHSFYHQPPALLMVDPTDYRINQDDPIIDAAGNYYVVNPTADNIENLPDDYYTDQVYGAAPDWVNVMILNNYGMLRTGRPVYGEYRDDIHYKDTDLKPMHGVKITIGMDLGLTPAAAFTQLSPKGEMVCFDELVTEDCSIQKFCEDYLLPHIYNNYRDFTWEIIVDPAATQRSPNDKRAAADIFRSLGIPYRTAPSQNPLKRQEAVVYFLRKIDGFTLGNRCGYLRKGFISGYKFEKKKVAISASDSDPKFKEKPEKNIYSHIHDGLQYAALELSEGRTAKRKKRKPRPKDDYKPVDNTAGY